MKCDECDIKINELLDERRRPESDDAVRSHLASCAPCRKRLAAYEALFDGLDLFETPSVSPHFAANVVAAVLVEPAPARTRWITWRTGLGVMAGLAALVMLAALPNLLPRQQEERTTHNNAPRGPGLATIHAPSHRVDPKVESPKLTEPSPVPKTSVPAVAVTNAAPQATAEQGVERYRHFMENFAPQLPESAPVWVNHLAGGIRPVANTFGEALHVLRRTLPSSRDESRPAKPSAERMPPGEFMPVA